MGRNMIVSSLLAVALLALACAPSPSGGGGAAATERPAKKRITAAMMVADVDSLSVTSAGTGADTLEFIIHAGLAQIDPRSVLTPQLAESVPTIENGLWKLLPDGRMETTWKIRPDARWHDGQPITADDLMFTARVHQDRDLALVSDPGFGVMDAMIAADSSTLTVTWKKPYILADSMIGHPTRLLPKHLLQRPYEEDKSRFLGDSYWTNNFVGAGPFKVRELEHSSHLLLEAFDGFVLGRPQLDEVEIRFIPDPGTFVANILAGEVQLSLGRNAAPDQAVQASAQWTDGKVVTIPYHGSSVGMYPQQQNPSLAALRDPRFRMALLYALDREEMSETIMFGLSAVAHTNVPPALFEFDQIQDGIVKYPFDLKKSAQLLEDLGYRRGASGFWEDPAGQRVGFEHRVAPSATQEVQRATLATTDYWQKAGLDVQLNVIGRLDANVAAEFPGILTKATGGDVSALYRYFHSSFAPVAENRFSGANSARWMIPPHDALLDRWFTAIPPRERAQALRELVRFQTEQAIWMGYFYNAQISWVSNRLRDVTPTSYTTKGFNAHRWDVV